MNEPLSEEGTVERDPPGERREQIGPYKILQRIGEGGFGSVYEAEQELPVKRRVALKIIKLGMDTGQVIARFEAERQALAMMDHPHIARVLDAGATEAGRPYFVMELVRGEPLASYCDRHNLPLVDRLRLFEQVCAAVQHAHTKGIIHRDLKPSNVLVSTHDDHAFAKVIDFGVAKATTSRLTEKTLFTEMNTMVGTPLYMSPEQAEGSADIDTRTDIYSLGVLLYELLTGTTPFDWKTLQGAPRREVQRIIVEVEPPRPSARLSQLASTLAEVASKRRTESKKLTRAVRELDWIVMKAIEKERSRRYETANALRMDVERYLAGEPVLAAPPSASYRLGKLVRRHKGAVSAVLLVAVTLVLGVVGTTASMLRAERERRAAERVASFMRNTLGGVGPSVARGRDTAMLKEMMAQAEGRIEKGELKDAPEAEIELRLSIGTTDTDLAAFDAADRMLAPAVDLARAHYGAEHRRVAEAIGKLGTLRAEQGRFSEAEALHREALAMQRKLQGSKHDDSVAESLQNLGATLVRAGKYAEAEPPLRESIAMRKELGTIGQEFAISLNDLAVSQRRQGKLAEAEAGYREALAIQRRVLGDDHPDLPATSFNLGRVLQEQGKFAEAEALYRESLALHRRLFGNEHPTVAANLNGLAIVLQEQGKSAEAETMLRASLTMARKLLGNNHVNVGTNLKNLANVLLQQGKFAEAESLAREAVSIVDRTAGRTEAAAAPRLSLGRALIGLGRYPEAEVVLEEADRIQGTAQGVPAARRKACLAALASLYSAWDKAIPGHGYDAKAADWHRKIEELK